MSYPTRLYATIRARLAGSTQVMIDTEILNTARDFCNEAAVWLETLSIPQVIGTTEYTVTPATSGAETAFILFAQVNDIPLRPWAGYRPMPASTWHVDLSDRTKVVRSSPSDTTDPIKVRLQLRPVTTGSLDLPNLLQEDHYEALLDGTLSRMYDHSTRPYSDLEKAEFHRKRYLSGMGKARTIAARGRTLYAAPWGFPTFARGTGGRPNSGGI